MKITKYICAALLIIQMSSAMKSDLVYNELEYSDCKEEDPSCWQKFKLGCFLTSQAVEETGKLVGRLWQTAHRMQVQINAHDLRITQKKNQ